MNALQIVHPCGSAARQPAAHCMPPVLLPVDLCCCRGLMHQTAFDSAYTAITADGARWLADNLPSVSLGSWKAGECRLPAFVS